MGFRTVVIKNRAKLDFCLNYLVYRGDKEYRLHLDELSMLIIESTAVSMTAVLLNELTKHKVKVIFCDEKHLPSFQLMGFDDNFHSSRRIAEQIAWSEDAKGLVWQNIIQHKIINQLRLLHKLGIEDALISGYLEDIRPGDSSNREGHAAKVYFNLLGNNARRDPSILNSALNYGYAILLSAFCRAITASGMITQLGIWHHNEFNPYNLACDMMETFRIIVDDLALNIIDNEQNFKYHMANITNARVKIEGKWQYLEAGIDIYVKSIVSALNTCNVEEIINFGDYELSIYENNSYV